MPPKVPAKIQTKIIYPPGVKEITEDLGTDELIRRLKACAQAFQNMGQDDNNQDFIPLAIHLALDSFLEHSNKDVRLLVACCIADVFRVYAPDAPYKDPEHLKNIFLFFIKQLRGLEDPKDPAFKRYFYLLENLAWVKSFNICIELEENQAIFCQLFTLMFTIVNDDHSVKVKNFMLDMMCPLISEADAVSQELLDIILSNIIEPRKTQNRNAYSLARDLLKKTASTIEPYIQAFFNNALILGKTSESDVASHLYELIYELNSISPSVLLAVLPQLEFKLKSNDEKERLDVTRLLARMFSDKDSELATQHRALWACFLGRSVDKQNAKQVKFNDISVAVRNRCVQYSMHFLLNHPELRADITEQLKLRQHDPEESVRYEVVMAIISAAKKDFSSISDELLDFVKERTLDKKFKIRKEALVGLSMIYKRCMNNPDIPESTRECVSWIKNKVLHVYYQTALEDRLLVERILHTCLVPYQLATDERVKKLYQLYATVDDHAVKAFNELFKCQSVVRNHVRGLLELHREGTCEDIEKQILQKIIVLAKSLPEPVKAQEFLRKFNTLLRTDARIRRYLEVILKPDCTTREAEDNVRELLKKLGNPVMTNVFYMTVKQLLERVAPVLIDKNAIECLMALVDQALEKTNGILEELGSERAPERGLRLLHTLSFVFPGAFDFTEIYTELLKFLSSPNEIAAEITLQILCNIGESTEQNHPDMVEKIIPHLTTFSKEGTGKQAKHAVRCLNIISSKKDIYFNSLLEDMKKNLTLDSIHYRTSLITIGHIALLCPENFAVQLKNIVKVVVKELLMQDKEEDDDREDEWCNEDGLSEETKCKIEGMKMMVRWLLGLKTNQTSAISSLRLFTSSVEHQGDLMNNSRISIPERSWLRMIAGFCILKICQEPAYAEVITTEQFQVVARLINDDCYQVREKFAQKLHKGLISLKLPLEFMAIFALGMNEPQRELKNALKQYLLANINKRRDYLKQHSLSSSKLLQYLPDYVLPYAIHLLAHDRELKKFDQVNALSRIKDCLWFLMEPLITKNENYSFGFFKKLLENIKQTKVAQCPDNEMQNMKLYAVCDLALGLVMSKTSNFVLKEHPVEPTLPPKLYTDIDSNFVNTKLYLPPELASMFPKTLGIDTDHNKSRPGGSGPGIQRGRGRGRGGSNGVHIARTKKLSTNGESEGAHMEEDEKLQELTGENVIIPVEDPDQIDAEGSEIHQVIEVITSDPIIGEQTETSIQNSLELDKEIQAVIEEDGTITIVKHIEVTSLPNQTCEVTAAEVAGSELTDKTEVNAVDAVSDAQPDQLPSEEPPKPPPPPAREVGSGSKRKPKHVPKQDDDNETFEKQLEELNQEERVASSAAASTEDKSRKRRNASQSAKPEEQQVSTTKRLRSSGPVTATPAKEDEKTSGPAKTTRAAASKSQESDKAETAETSPPASPARGTRQLRKATAKPEAVTSKKVPEKPAGAAAKTSATAVPQAPSMPSTSASAATVPAAAAATPLTRRALRRNPNMTNGAGRSNNSDDDNQDSSQRKSARVQTRNVQKDSSPSTPANVKTKTATGNTRKVR